MRFENDTPIREIFEGDRLRAAAGQLGQSSLPLLVLLPDDLFFFFRPEAAPGQGGTRQRLAAARLQMEHMFPQAGNGQKAADVLSVGRDQYLVACPHPALEDFVSRHQEVLRQANAVSTPFFLAWHTAFAHNIAEWGWVSLDEKIRAAVSSQSLDYFPGDTHEWRKRQERQGCEHFKQWSLSELLSAAPGIGWARLRLPLPVRSEDETSAGQVLRWGLALALLLALFCLGQGLRLTGQKRQLAHWEQATEELYAQVLSGPVGSDPYGRLLFRLDQLQAPTAEDLDVMEMLGVLSAAAPSDFQVESLSLGPSSGTIRARLNDYDQLEVLLKALDGRQRFVFALDQATSADNEILATLRVTY